MLPGVGAPFDRRHANGGAACLWVSPSMDSATANPNLLGLLFVHRDHGARGALAAVQFLLHVHGACNLAAGGSGAACLRAPSPFAFCTKVACTDQCKPIQNSMDYARKLIYTICTVIRRVILMSVCHHI